MAYSKPVVAHRNLAVAAFEAAGVDRVIGGPIAARAVFLFRRPDSHYRPASRRLGRPARAELGPLAPDEHVQDPDLDKLQRLVADALKVGGIIAEDNLITDWSARKAWTHNESHTRITLYRKADPDATVRRHTRIVDPLPGL
jgi:Holliday junction resolvase RusA-like endonuclease